MRMLACEKGGDGLENEILFVTVDDFLVSVVSHWTPFGRMMLWSRVLQGGGVAKCGHPL